MKLELDENLLTKIDLMGNTGKGRVHIGHITYSGAGTRVYITNKRIVVDNVVSRLLFKPNLYEIRFQDVYYFKLEKPIERPLGLNSWQIIVVKYNKEGKEGELSVEAEQGKITELAKKLIEIGIQEKNS